MTFLIRLALVSIALALSGCAVQRISATESLDEKLPALRAHLQEQPDAELVVTRLSGFGAADEGLHCFEPMLYAVSLGVIPAHCRSRHHLSSQSPAGVEVSELETDVVVTSMQGWLPLFLAVLPSWQFYDGGPVEEDVRDFVEDELR